MENIFKFNLFINSFPKLLSRLHITLFIVVMALVFGILLGIIVAVLRLYKVPILSQLAVGYVSFLRGTPILVQLYISYIGMPLIFQLFGVNINRWDNIIYVFIAYSMNTSAFLSEIIRVSVLSVDKSQTEAAYSVGMTKLQTFKRIVGPQAVQISIPDLGNTIVSLFKDTSLAYTLGIVDVIGAIKAISSNTHRSLEAYAAAAIIFFVLSYILEFAFNRIEKKIGVKSKIHNQRVNVNRKIAMSGR